MLMQFWFQTLNLTSCIKIWKYRCVTTPSRDWFNQSIKFLIIKIKNQNYLKNRKNHVKLQAIEDNVSQITVFLRSVLRVRSADMPHTRKIFQSKGCVFFPILQKCWAKFKQKAMPVRCGGRPYDARQGWWFPRGCPGRSSGRRCQSSSPSPSDRPCSWCTSLSPLRPCTFGKYINEWLNIRVIEIFTMGHFWIQPDLKFPLSFIWSMGDIPPNSNMGKYGTKNSWLPSR